MVKIGKTVSFLKRGKHGGASLLTLASPRGWTEILWGGEAPVLTVGTPSPARWCSLAFWASKYSLKGFCSAAPRTGTALFPPTEEEGGRGGGRGAYTDGRKKKRRRGGGTNHVTSLLLTSPRAATKGDMLSYLLYSVGLLPLSEKTGRATSAFTHHHRHTHTATQQHKGKNLENKKETWQQKHKIKRKMTK